MNEVLKDEKIRRLERHLTRYKLMELAQDSIGIYPAAYNGVPRTPEMDGHNDALIEVSNNRERAEEWFNRLSEGTQGFLSDLVMNDVLLLEVTKEEINMWINVNDIFAPAADGEGFTLEELPRLHKAFCKWGEDGVLALVSHKRGAKPWRYEKFLARHPKFEEALIELGRN